MSTVACGGSDAASDENGDSGEADISAALGIARIAAPAGLPKKPWNQPDSRGWFGEKGMCGPTSTANLLLMYGTLVSPQVAYEAGDHSAIGTLPNRQELYLDASFPDLACDYDHAESTAFLRDSVAAGRPVNIMIGMGGTSAHWITVVGARFDVPSNEWKYIVMTWGRYGEIGDAKLRPNWATGYAGQNPYVRCALKSRYTLPVTPPR
jgi:hypothetical protein